MEKKLDGFLTRMTSKIERALLKTQNDIDSRVSQEFRNSLSNSHQSSTNKPIPHPLNNENDNEIPNQLIENEADFQNTLPRTPIFQMRHDEKDENGSTSNEESEEDLKKTKRSSFVFLSPEKSQKGREESGSSSTMADFSNKKSISSSSKEKIGNYSEEDNSIDFDGREESGYFWVNPSIVKPHPSWEQKACDPQWQSKIDFVDGEIEKRLSVEFNKSARLLEASETTKEKLKKDSERFCYCPMSTEKSRTQELKNRLRLEQRLRSQRITKLQNCRSIKD